MIKRLSFMLLEAAVLVLCLVGVPRLLEYDPYMRALDATLSLGLSFKQIALLMTSIGAAGCAILAVNRRLGWLSFIPLGAIAMHLGITGALGGAFSEFMDYDYMDYIGYDYYVGAGAFVGYFITAMIGVWFWFFGSVGNWIFRKIFPRRDGRIPPARTLFRAGNSRIAARRQSRLGKTPSRARPSRRGAREDPNPHRRIAQPCPQCPPPSPQT